MTDGCSRSKGGVATGCESIFIQEDAKRAPKLASISSAVSKIEVKPVEHADFNDSFPVSDDKSVYSSLESDSKWWLQLQPDYIYQRGLTSEKQVNPNPHQFVKNQDGSINSVDSMSSKESYEFMLILGLRAGTKKQKYDRISEKKMLTPIEAIILTVFDWTILKYPQIGASSRTRILFESYCFEKTNSFCQCSLVCKSSRDSFLFVADLVIIFVIMTKGHDLSISKNKSIMEKLRNDSTKRHINLHTGVDYWAWAALDSAMLGFLISDWQGIDRLTDPPHSNYTLSILQSIEAGLDMIMVPYNYTEFIDGLRYLVTNKFIPVSRIDDAVKRILRVEFVMGLFENPYHNSISKNTVDPTTEVMYEDFLISNFSYAIVLTGEHPYSETVGDSLKLTIPEPGPTTFTNVCGAVKCVVVLIFGRPVVTEPYVSFMDALVAAWLHGSEGQVHKMEHMKGMIQTKKPVGKMNDQKSKKPVQNGTKKLIGKKK
ncbi:LOW QUALITY PROTEIN: hypothetical protein M8C21_017590 [Ambrosia artemisiifolia]|uniref:Glycoside hydrolase family 3 N-terminal domain-containing protein n=1 Tax=Ambrosia artemisiifolia TaxID=4212 RepID=A0AAD5CUM1_AMBAR|nr:LOW QUALITY PROTEIN: hypothetical protein M8C21_017590 [Ambrosia artemisiifolia]